MHAVGCLHAGRHANPHGAMQPMRCIAPSESPPQVGTPLANAEPMLEDGPGSIAAKAELARAERADQEEAKQKALQRRNKVGAGGRALAVGRQQHSKHSVVTHVQTRLGSGPR